MLSRRKKWILRRFALALAVAAVAAPTAQARIDEQGGTKASVAPQIENVRLEPRSTARSSDGIENVRVQPRTGESPSLVASPGFSWGDAGIGAGVALVLVAIGGGALMASRGGVKPQTA